MNRTVSGFLHQIAVGVLRPRDAPGAAADALFPPGRGRDTREGLRLGSSHR
jgi:hypothetical protein